MFESGALKPDKERQRMSVHSAVKSVRSPSPREPRSSDPPRALGSKVFFATDPSLKEAQKYSSTLTSTNKHDSGS